MVMISRISRLFQADLHAVLDRIEEPQVSLRQAVREMEQVLTQDQQRSRLLQQEQRQLSSRQDKLQQDLQRIGEELEVCFQSDKEDLARKLIRRQLETRQLFSFLAEKRNTLEHSIAEFRTRLEQNQGHLDSMRQKMELLSSEDQAVYPEDDWNLPDYRVADEDVEVAFLREKQKRSQP